MHAVYKKMKCWMTNKRRAAIGLLFLFCAVILGASLFLEYGLGVKPCILCLYERWIWVVVSLMCLLSLCVFSNPYGQQILLFLIMLFCIYGTI